MLEHGGKSRKKRTIIVTARKLAVLLPHLRVSAEFENSRRFDKEQPK
jgi:hypothetical protein